MLTASNSKIVGDIYVVNPHNLDDSVYSMILSVGNVNENVIKSKIETVVGDDTILLVRWNRSKL